jgi:PAS domain S-box-containing protein
MMKYFPFRLIKRSDLEILQRENASKHAQIISATEFVKEIAKGNLEAVYREDSTLTSRADNILSHSLMELSTQLKKLAREEKQRNWVTESRAKFIDILRSRNDDMRALAENIITNLVKTMRANQGALYLVNDERETEPHIEIAACYAYERKKYLTQRIALGEGLVGQCVLEKASVYMTDIPNDYLRITSGLGAATPKNLLIVPLKLEEQIFGVVEIASFETIRPHEIEFLEQLGESIASTISVAKINQQTKKMLMESQAQAEQMRLQEEVMRQSMEELSATQDEMQRVLREVQEKEQYMNELMNVSKDPIVAIDRNYQIISYNQALADGVAAMGFSVEKGSNYLQLYPETEHSKQQSLFEQAFQGETFELTQTFTNPAGEVHILFSYCPIRNEQEAIIAIAIYSKNISEMANARKEAERLLHASLQQTEELRAQEEELRQNMEELSATQEEMQRILLEVQNKEQYLNDLIDATQDTILTIDRAYNLISYNQAMQNSYKAQGITLEKGASIRQVITEDQWPIFKAHYDRALSGETFQLAEHYHLGELNMHFLINYSPLKDHTGAVTGVAVFAKDVTEATLAKQQTEKLLTDTQQQAEELKAQQEELRQNMEELSATQEEMQRILLEVQAKEQYIRELLDASSDSILTIDKDYRLISGNKVFMANFQEKGIQIGKGFDILQIFPPEEKKKKIALYERIFAGEYFEETEHLTANGLDHYFMVRHAPLRNGLGEIIALAIFTKDVTEQTKAHLQAEQLLREAKTPDNGQPENKKK